MYTFKYIVFYILVLIVLPFNVIISQETFADSIAENELENKYDSVISKAAFSLTSAQYKQSLDYYKEASLLKPQDSYPGKMIKYVESIMADIAAKQKLADESKRRAQIRDDLKKANQAIINRSWDSARILFSRILTLKPEKTDEEYAKSKISAIDLELKRIVLLTPPPPTRQEPVTVAPPRNRQEARARRKLAERNAILTSISNKDTLQKPVETSLPQTKVAAASATKEPPQKPAEAPLPQTNVAAAPATKEPMQKPAEASLPQTKVAAAPATKEPPQKPVKTPLPQTKVAAAPATKEPRQKPAEASLPQTNVAAAPATKEQPHKPAETPLPQTNVAAAPATKEPPQKPAEAPLPQTNVAAAPATKEQPHKPAEAPLPQTNVAAAPATKEPPQKPAETPLPQANVGITAPLSKEIPPKAIEGSLSRLTDSSNYIKLICQDISFIGKNAYIKVLIQNYSTTESFLTDTLQIAIKKNDGNVKKLEQRFISDFPVIMPQKELILISFADASVSVAPNDVFILEMDDKMKKTKLALQIPRSLFKQPKAL